jgi:hypothetical protein
MMVLFSVYGGFAKSLKVFVVIRDLWSRDRTDEELVQRRDTLIRCLGASATLADVICLPADARSEAIMEAIRHELDDNVQ